MNKKEFADYLRPKAEEIEDFIKNNMPDKGLKCEDSQRLCLLNIMMEFGRGINGTTEDDFVIKTYEKAKREPEYDKEGTAWPWAVGKSTYDEFGEYIEGSKELIYHASEEAAELGIEKINDPEIS